MSAACWGCANGVAPVGAAGNELPLDPLGTCWECQVLGCRAHAFKDLGAGKWICCPDVASAAAISGGLRAVDRVERSWIRFESSEELKQRFPVLARETEEDRMRWRTGAGEGQLGREIQQLEVEEPRDFHLIGDAVGIAMFLQPGLYAAFEARLPSPPTWIFSGQLGQLVSRLTGGD